jgi:hypothetical protein
MGAAAALSFVACSGSGDPDTPGEGIDAGVRGTPGALTSSDMVVPPGRTAPFTADHFTVALRASQTASIIMCRCTTNTSGDMDPFLEVAFNGAVMWHDDDCGGNYGAMVTFTAPSDGTYDIYPEDCCREPVPSDGMSRRYVLFVRTDALVVNGCFADGGTSPPAPCPAFPPPGFGCQ